MQKAKVFKINYNEELIYDQLRQKGIHFGILIDPPYVYPCFKDSFCQKPGYSIELIREVCDMLSVPCRLTAVNHTMYGDNLLGYWRGMVRHIMDGEFDTSIPNFTPTPERLKVIQLSYPIASRDEILVTEFSNLQAASAYGLLTTFTWKVWIIVAGAMLLLAAAVTIFQTCLPKVQRSISYVLLNLIENFLQALAVFSGREMTQTRSASTQPGEQLFYVWGFFCIILTGIYSSNIMATALQNRVDLPFSNLEDFAECVKLHECILTTDSISTAYFENVFKAESGVLGKLRKALENNQPMLKSTKNAFGLLNWKQSPGIRTVAYTTDAKFAAVSELYPTCSFAVIHTDIRSSNGFPLRNDSLIRPFLDRAIISLRENGIVQKIYRKYFGYFLETQAACYKTTMSADPLSFYATQGAVILVLFGGGIGILAFLFEKLNRYGKELTLTNTLV